MKTPLEHVFSRSSLYDANVFFPLFVVLLLCGLIHFKFVRNRGNGKHRACAIVLACAVWISFVLTVAFEFYFGQMCPVQIDRHIEQERALVLTMSVLKGWGLNYWLDFGTLLAAMRGSPSILRWDADSDVSLVHPGDEKLNAIIAAAPQGLDVRSYPERDSVRIYASQYAWTDIWLWREGKDDLGRATLSTPPIHPCKQHTRNMEDIFPLQSLSWPTRTTADGNGNAGADMFPSPISPQDISPSPQTYIPRDADRILRDEYGDGYMEPRVARYECFSHLYARRVPGIYVLGTVAVLLIPLCVFLLSLRREQLRTHFERACGQFAAKQPQRV
jgi:hypothetical protein